MGEAGSRWAGLLWGRAAPQNGVSELRESRKSAFIRKSLGGLAAIHSLDPKTSQCRGLPPRNISPVGKAYLEAHKAHNVQKPPIIVYIVKHQSYTLYRAGIQEISPGISS